MEEYIAYSEIANETLIPLIACVTADRSQVTYRDLVKDDIMYIYDDEHEHEDPEHPMKADPLGGWLFKNSGVNKSSFHRRYALLKGGFVFFFHAPSNDKPVACVPLVGCELRVPHGGAKTFDPPKVASRQDTSGYEVGCRVSHVQLILNSLAPHLPYASHRVG